MYIKDKNEKVMLTKEGLEELKRELQELIDVKRPEVVTKISVARDMGDLSENAAYVSARDQQAFIEGRISELEDIIKKAVVSTGVSSGGIVSVGSKIRVHVDGGEEEYIVVGAPEADPKEGKISHESPLGNALVGKKVGDKVEIEAPMGKLVYTILSVS
ncbi:TPA: transcription elongation factor GreA [candidate division WWE3 bacterium]|uniref:Transcription elongation factor GreA n=4 Tax=Katanobacteria TaxID=422282 RepID=A0A0G1HER7_UNCKA|nr:MAG: Transcription elongation factor GreA [candidate division WWE3 bacterium GW2011_GWA2_44_16]KKT69703.1 MAG: Transcription elongation factor GreA [candidate division WWE3 bacterium GW2011_GWB1_44_4]OGC52454.1 MAG: transcription elongation factor GreA [candidate division WWE3 bacterium RIFCSPHIGHO2_01_FULL_43_9]HAZ29387.1 transcription elongation factor GreA [candidate division WWE3 bacterium]